MLKTRVLATTSLLLISATSIISCAGKPPVNLGVTDMSFVPCPKTPNCVSSDSSDTDHKVSSLTLDAPAERVWAGARAYLVDQPRTRIISETPVYIHAEFESLIFGFVDDLEIHLRMADGIIAIRSASRVGYSDFGVNRDRVEKMRENLKKQGLVR